MAINLLTRSSGSSTAYIVIFGSTSITNLQRLSKTVEYSCRWSSGTLVNLIAAILRVIYSFFVRCTNMAALLIRS